MNKQKEILEAIDRVTKAAVELHDMVKVEAEKSKESRISDFYGRDMFEICTLKEKVFCLETALKAASKERDEAREEVERLQEERKGLVRIRNKMIDIIVKMVEEKR